MPAAPADALRRSLESGRIHSAYLLAGPGPEPRDAALSFARGLVCQGTPPGPCGDCPACQRSTEREEPLALDGAGRRGPLYRHVGDHPDLFWLERGSGDTRVRIGQVRALQAALRLRSHEGGRRAVVLADAEWLNQEAQNALLRLLEEPPPDTTLVLVATTASGLLATVRSRCQRLAFAPPTSDASDDDPEARALRARIDGAADLAIPELLDWAEEYRGVRAEAAAAVEELLASGSAWLHARARTSALAGTGEAAVALDAFATLARCRKALAQRNANPQMVAERALLALRGAGQ